MIRSKRDKKKIARQKYDGKKESSLLKPWELFIT